MPDIRDVFETHLYTFLFSYFQSEIITFELEIIADIRNAIVQNIAYLVESANVISGSRLNVFLVFFVETVSKI